MAKTSAGLAAKQPLKSQPANDAASREAAVNTKTQKARGLLKKSLILLLIIILLAGGFFLGIYLRILDADKLNNSLHLYDWPIIGSNFVKPSDETAQQAKTQKVDVAANDAASSAGSTAAGDQTQAGQQSKPVLLTKKQLDDQKKAREAEVNKRIGKVSRIYGQMDPKKAAAALTPLDDNVVASVLQKMDDARSAKILENFDSTRAAQITQTIYNGVTPPTLPQLDSAAAAAAAQGGQ